MGIPFFIVLFNNIHFFPSDMFQSIVTSTRKEAFSGPVKSTSSVCLDEEGPEEKDCWKV